MYIKNIHIEGYGPVENLTIDFVVENGSCQPTVMFGLQGSGKSFILNKLYQILKKWHQQFYCESDKEVTLETDEQKVECYYEHLINIEKSYSRIEGCLISNSQDKPFREIFRRKNTEIPPDIVENLHTHFPLESDELTVDFNLHISNRRLLSPSVLRPHQEAHDKYIYFYFPSSRINRNPWGYLHHDNFFSLNYPMTGTSDRCIIQNNCYGDVVMWLQHIIFQHYRIQAERLNDNHSKLIEFSLEKLQTLLVNLLGEQFQNYQSNLSFDSENRRIFIELIEQRTNVKQSIPLESLSESQLSLFVMFALILKHCEKQILQFEALEGVVLMDNAEQGLDSTTQLLYFPWVIQQFPKVQFVFSTSSIYILQGLKQQFGNHFNYVDLSKPEPFLNIAEMNLQEMSSALKKRMDATPFQQVLQTEVKLEEDDKNEAEQVDTDEIIESLLMDEDVSMMDVGSSGSALPQSQLTELTTVEQDVNTTETAERKAYLETIQLMGKNLIFPENFTWKNIPMFSVIAGKNGVGKTQFLKLLAEHIRNLKQYYKREKRIIEKNIDSSEILPYQNIQVLYYGCSTEVYVNYDDDRRFSDFSNATHQKANKYYTIYFSSRMVTDNETYSQSMLSQLSEPEILHYTETVSLFERNKRRFDDTAKQSHNYEQSMKQSFELCARKTAGLPIFLAAYPNMLISYLLDLMFDDDLSDLNQMLRKSNFKYCVTKTRDDFRFSHNNENFELTCGTLKLQFSNLSPGERLELMTLIWIYDSNLMHPNQPALLLLDEPDAHLHPSLTYDVIERIKNRLVAVYGVQVIMTTHNPITISQLMRTEHLFIMTRENATKKPEIIKATTKREVSQHLIAYSTCVNQRMRFVFVEADDDVRFYEILYRKLLSVKPENSLDAPLFFKAHGQKKQTGSDKESSQKGKQKQVESDDTETGDNSSSGLVKRLVEKFVPRDEDDNTLKDFMYGIVDGDNQNPDGLPQNVMALQRYSIENYLCDPLHIFYILMGRRSTNENYIKLKCVIESSLKENEIELPSTFTGLRGLSPAVQNQIAQTILDQMIALLFEILKKNENEEYSHIIKIMRTERFKLCRNGGTFDDAKVSVKFIQGYQLEYPVFFIKMQGHKLESLYNVIFGTSNTTGFASKKDFLKFFEMNDILIPEELCNIISKISCGSNEHAADRREELRRIEKKERAIVELPVMQKENEQKKRKLNELQGVVSRSISENKKLKTDKNNLMQQSQKYEFVIAKHLPDEIIKKEFSWSESLHIKSEFFKVRRKKLYESKDDAEKFSKRYAKVKLAFNKLEACVKNSKTEQERLTGEAALTKASESCENFIKNGLIQENEGDKIFWRENTDHAVDNGEGESSSMTY